MSNQEFFDPLTRFAEIERLVVKIYFRFSHPFLHQPELRDFWWQMAKEEEQHGSILSACKALIENYDDETSIRVSVLKKLKSSKADCFRFWLKGLPHLVWRSRFALH